jgi:hypothetical protein
LDVARARSRPPERHPYQRHPTALTPAWRTRFGSCSRKSCHGRALRSHYE